MYFYSTMGAYQSAPLLQDFAPTGTGHKPKNSEYYSGKRFVKVPRFLYPQYTRGFLYGYTIDPNYWANVWPTEGGE